MKKFILLLFVPLQIFASPNDQLINDLNSRLQEQIAEINETFDNKKILIVDEEKLQFYFKGKLDAYYELLIYINHLHE